MNLERRIRSPGAPDLARGDAEFVLFVFAFVCVGVGVGVGVGRRPLRSIFMPFS